MYKWLWLIACTLPSAVWACPVCGTAPQRSQDAYVAMTVVLSLLPLGFIGALVYLAFRRIQRAEAQRSAELLAPPPAHADAPRT
jgi:hypothetical protein